MASEKKQEEWFEVMAGPGAIFQVRAINEEEALVKTDQALETSIRGIAPYVGMLALDIDSEEKRIAEHVFQTTNGPEVILRSFTSQGSELNVEITQKIAAIHDHNQQQLDLENEDLRKVVTITA